MATPLLAIFFDVDDTVYSTTEFAELARRNAVKAMINCGLRIDEDEAHHELSEVILEFSSNYEHHFDKLLLRLPPESYHGANPQILVAAGMVAYHQTKFRHLSAYEDALEVLRILKDRRIRLGIITAGVSIKQAEKIYRLGLHELVEPTSIYITESLGIAKTNPKIYLRACRENLVQPEQCLYVGDNPTVDVDVPKSIGIHTALSRRSGKYSNVHGDQEPDHVIHNFYDLLEILESAYELVPMPE